MERHSNNRLLAEAIVCLAIGLGIPAFMWIDALWLHSRWWEALQ